MGHLALPVSPKMQCKAVKVTDSGMQLLGCPEYVSIVLEIVPQFALLSSTSVRIDKYDAARYTMAH